MAPLFINMPDSRVFRIRELIDYENGYITSRRLSAADTAKILLMAFAAGKTQETHSSSGDTLTYVLEGEAEIVRGGISHTLEAGQCLMIPADTPHSLRAISPCKILLMVLMRE